MSKGSVARRPDSIRALVLATLITLSGPLIVASSGSKGAPQSRKVEIAGEAHLQYLEWGTSASPPLVLLAGLGDTAYIFEELGSLLAPHFHVFAVTRRGYGESSLTREGYAIGERADDLRAFLDALKLDRVYLAGHSVAGDELTAFAAKYRQRLRGLIYLDAAYDRADPLTPQPHMDAWLKVAAQLYGGLSEADTYSSFEVRRRALEKLFQSEYGVPWSDALADNLRETTVTNADGSLSPRTPGWVGQAIRQSNRSERVDVSAVQVPALLLFARGRLEGESISIDPASLGSIERDEDEYESYFQQYLRRLREANPKLEIRTMEHARHYFFLKDPAGVARQIQEFARATANAAP